MDHHEAHEEHEGRKHFFKIQPSPSADLRVLRDLRGEKVCIPIRLEPFDTLRANGQKFEFTIKPSRSW